MNTTLAATNQRIHTLDAVRGFALMGIVLVNILPLLQTQNPLPGSPDAWMYYFLNFAVESRFFVIFSILFGVGFHLFISRAKAKGANSTALFIRRLIVLLILGFVHKQFHPGEALFIYAIFGFLLMPFYRLQARTNLLVGLILALLVCATGFKPLLVLPLFILGLAVGQYGVFQNIEGFMPVIKKIQGVTLLLSLIGLYVQYLLIPANMDLSYAIIVDEGISESALQQLTYYTIAITSVGLVMAAFYTTTLMRLLQNRTAQALLSPLAAYGRMALTNYVGQTVLILGAGYLFDLYGKVGYVQTTLICLAIYVVQIAFSSIWLSVYKMGPLEWVWRAFTYMSFSPMRRERSGAR
ncbi:DUF418 domain-containing protein [Brevibacillus reuszeri]|uniref:DUF418 domain-containing protein n=1 Tax=Brevibacillus reuszeri TaxID=54915 RepID=UPI0028A25177|nr:DUF418 domain-containing protein [Brevibacillus reuszeri]